MSYTPLSRRQKPRGINLKIIVSLGLLISYLVYTQIQYSKAVENGFDSSLMTKQTILVAKGDSAKEVGKMLQEKGIIKKSSYFTKYMSKENLEDKIIAGSFAVSPAMSIKTIALIVTDVKQARNSITIPEGYSIRQIDARLTEQELIKTGEFIDTVKKFANYDAYPFLPKAQMIGAPIPLEGFLFPDTYHIDPSNFSSTALIELMLENFKKKLPKNISQQLSEKNISLFELTTVASMLEKEVRHPEDLPTVAGIIWKRANSGWFLNIDASILYSTGKKTLSSADLKEDSPYNTYIRKGLPLSPISNPGEKAMLAALNPQKTAFWFYLTDPKTGKAVYASTNDGHNRNRGIYLR